MPQDSTEWTSPVTAVSPSGAGFWEKACGIRFLAGLTGMEGAVDDLLLLFPGQLDEVHGIAGNADGEDVYKRQLPRPS